MPTPYICPSSTYARHRIPAFSPRSEDVYGGGQGQETAQRGSSPQPQSPTVSLLANLWPWETLPPEPECACPSTRVRCREVRRRDRHSSCWADTSTYCSFSLPASLVHLSQSAPQIEKQIRHMTEIRREMTNRNVVQGSSFSSQPATRRAVLRKGQ